MSEISQEQTIINMLRKAGNKGVENFKFPQRHILKYSSRISDLRNDGVNIYCERQYRKGRATGVWKYYINE
jgi:hypothetical protein